MTFAIDTMLARLNSLTGVAEHIHSNIVPSLTAYDGSTATEYEGDGRDSDGEKRLAKIYTAPSTDGANLTALDDLDELALAAWDIVASFTDYLDLEPASLPYGFRYAPDGTPTGLRPLDDEQVGELFDKLSALLRGVWMKVEAYSMATVFEEEYERLLRPIVRRWPVDEHRRKGDTARPRQCPKCDQLSVNGIDEVTVGCSECPWTATARLKVPVANAAQRVGKTRQSIEKWIKAGQIESWQINGKAYVDITEVQKQAELNKLTPKARKAAKAEDKQALDLPILIRQAIAGDTALIEAARKAVA